LINQINDDIFYNENFPRSNNYDTAWIFKHKMGPHPLWLTEFLVQPFNLKPGMRVLDLACGKGITSVFLAREFGVQVYSVDFDEWEGCDTIATSWNNAKEYGLEDLIVPIKADARNLPFAPEFFDAIICTNAYFYFGADEDYLDYVAKYLHTGGQIGMIVPGYMRDNTKGVPDYMEEFDDGSCVWQPLSWWKALWEKSESVSINTADTLPDGCNLWLLTDEIADGSETNEEIEVLRMDKGEYIGFIRLVATKK